MTVADIKNKILPILKRQGVTKAALFGSAARGEMTAKSDVDILVELPPEIGLFEFVGIKQELEERLGRKVDLVEYKAIKPALREIILQDQIAFL